MDIKLKEISYNQLEDEPKEQLPDARKISKFFRFVIYVLSSITLRIKRFKYNEINLDRNLKKQPCVVVMNHGSFIDMMIAAKLLRHHPYSTVTMNEAFIGRKDFLLKIGSIPIHKFLSSPKTIIDSIKVIKEYKQSILIFPEAVYSFDGTSSPLSPQLGKYIKMLGAPVLFIKTRGPHLYQPLFNRLKIRKVKLSATMECLLTKEDINSKSDSEIFNIVNDKFKNINYYKEQLEDGVLIKNKDRTDYLESALYKCPHCLKEGKMYARGTTIKCLECGEEYTLNEDGTLINNKGNTKFASIPDWYKWQRECVRQELLNNTYSVEFDGIVYAAKNYLQFYKLKESAHFKHDCTNQFSLNINDVFLRYNYNGCYSINSDLYFYQIGDIVSVGDQNVRYFISPTNIFSGIVTKIRFAVEEKYKLSN